MSITVRDDGLVICTAGDSYELPSAVGNNGISIRVKNTGVNDVVVSAPVGQTIDTKATWDVKPGQMGVFIAEAGNWVISHNGTMYVHATFRSPIGGGGRFHCFGYYTAAATHKAATQAAATQTFGTANVAYGAKAFIVAAGPGTASGGTTGVGKITVSGTSVTDDGVRQAGDSEILVPDTSVLTTNMYVESHKYWIGQVTFTLGQTGNRTSYAATFNYGYAKYYEFEERKFVLAAIEVTGRAGASDTGFNIELLKHDGTGWTYAASGFVPGGTVIASMRGDYVTEVNLAAGERFGWERYNLATIVDAAADHTGLVLRITTGVPSSVDTLDVRLKGHAV